MPYSQVVRATILIGAGDHVDTEGADSDLLFLTLVPPPNGLFQFYAKKNERMTNRRRGESTQVFRCLQVCPNSFVRGLSTRLCTTRKATQPLFVCVCICVVIETTFCKFSHFFFLSCLLSSILMSRISEYSGCARPHPLRDIALSELLDCLSHPAPSQLSSISIGGLMVMPR